MAALLQHQEDDLMTVGKNAPFLFRLPNVLLMDILSEWLDLASIARLDTAVTPHDGCRRYFLRNLQEMSAKSAITFEFTLNECSLRWLSIRRVPIESIVLPLWSEAVFAEMRLYSLRTVSVTGIDDLRLTHLINNHPLLVSLTLDDGDHRGLSDRGIQLIGQHLPLLERLSFDYYGVSISCTSIIAVIQ